MLYDHPPSITVILTCYNREDCIGRAITSILWQTFCDFELIVVDDGSTDSSQSVINSFNDSRIKLFLHEKNRGQNAAINTGLGKARGNFIAFLDSDDIWFPDFLGVMHSAFEPEIGFVYSNIFGGPKSSLTLGSSLGDVYYQGYLSSMISIMIRSECIEKVGFFDESYDICQDDKFCFLLAKYFRFKLVNGVHALAIGSVNSVTANPLRLIKGWERLFNDFRSEIILHCGRRGMAKHYFFLAGLYAGIFEWCNLFRMLRMGVGHLFGSRGNYPKPSFFDLPSVFLIISLRVMRSIFAGRF